MKIIDDLSPKCREMYEQIISYSTNEKILSWGIFKISETEIENSPALVLSVHGLLLHGVIIIHRNKKDLYRVFAFDFSCPDDFCINDVYYTLLAKTIDYLCERKNTWSDDDYRKYCEEHEKTIVRE